MHKLSKALTFMGAILALTFCAVSCKTDDDDEPTMYTVTVSDSLEHGKVTADKSSAEAGATVKLTATADSGYELDSYSVKDEKSNTITVTEGTFTMPKSNVTVSATFKETTVTPQKTAGSISYATTTVSKTTAAEPFTNELTKTGDGTVTYASSKETVATVNEDGEVTIKGAGETTITATVADSDTYTYATKTASYTLTVKQPVTLKTGGAINSILVSLCPDGYGYSVCTKFARSDTNNDKATLYLDTEGKYIPVWSKGTEVYYYVPDGCTPVMNEDSSGMFNNCSELTSLEVTGFDTSNVTNMSKMFRYCSKLTSLDVTGFDTSKVTNMSEMFANCFKLTGLDVSKFDTSNVTNMSKMFFECYGLASLDVTGFNTSNVTDMTGMFAFCSGLASLDVTGFDTSKVSNMQSMFYGCKGLTSLDVSKFNTSKVTNMQSMFGSCSGLNSLDVSKFDTSNVTNMESMFYNCSGLTSLDVSKFVTSNVTNMLKMFYNCSGLKSLDVTGFDTSNVTYMKEMFSGCEGLTTIYATDKFVTTGVTNGDSCFNKCSNLEGGAGTTYDESKTSATYARIDGGTDAPGYFTPKPIGSKSKPDAVGDIVFSDGSATPYTADLTLTNEEKAAAIAVIFYVGTDCSNDSTSRTLGVGLAQNHGGLAWCLDSANASEVNITTIQESDKDGSDNLSQIGEFLNDNNDTGTADKYPAFYFAENYSGTATNLGETYADGWYLPAKAELQKIYDILSTVNKELAACGGTTFDTSGVYWSSSQYASAGYVAYGLNFASGGWYTRTKGNSSYSVCAVRAFN